MTHDGGFGFFLAIVIARSSWLTIQCLGKVRREEARLQ